MKHRKLRIAWSVAWSIVAVLLIALWSRSYWRIDGVIWNVSEQNSRFLNSQSGRLIFEARAFSFVPLRQPPRLEFTTSKADASNPVGDSWFGFQSYEGYVHVVLPTPLLVGLSAILAIAPWIRSLGWRFSLRTLLIATTLVAVGLGLIMWLMR